MLKCELFFRGTNGKYYTIKNPTQLQFQKITDSRFFEITLVDYTELSRDRYGRFI